MRPRLVYSTLLHSAIIAAALTMGLLPLQSASAAKLKALHTFCEYEYCVDGGPPVAKLLLDNQGNIFGTNYGGGPYGRASGAVFELRKSPTGYTYTLLYAFCAQSQCTDGWSPRKLIRDTKGNLYGIAEGGNGGLGAEGSVFELSPNSDRSQWAFKKIYDFFVNGFDYALPMDITYAGEAAGAAYDGASPLYGVQYTGGGGSGVYEVGGVFQLTRNADASWREDILHGFCSVQNCTDGWNPVTLIAASPTRLFGLTANGGTGACHCGVAFELKKGSEHWRYRTLYSFCSLASCADGRFAYGLVLDGKGALYGTVYHGGAHDQGGIFKLIPKRKGSKERLLYNFCSLPACADGANPLGGVAFDLSGALVGVTEQGGLHEEGTIFRLSGSQLTVLYNFCPGTPTCKQGKEPLTGVTVGSDGTIFGSTTVGGSPDAGTVYGLGP